MHLPLSRLLSFGVLFALSATARAHAEKTHEWNWLSEADKARILESIPPAPGTNSDVDRQDLAELLKIQTNRSAAEIASAKNDRHFSFDMITKVLDPGFTHARFPVCYSLLERADEDESLLNSTLKKRYHRLRPYQAHREVKPLFEVEQYSYPSGHSSGSHVLATILAKLFPGKRDALEERADSVGHGRVVAGVHYPSDVAQGKKLAQALTDALMANPAFEKDMALALMEVLRNRANP